MMRLPFLAGSFRAPRRLSVVVLFALAVASVLAMPADAGTLNIEIENTTAAPGTTGQFDIFVVNNTASAVNVASFYADAFLPDTTFVTFTAIDNGTTHPYIFNSTGSSGFISQLLPNEAAGTDTGTTSQVVNPGQSFGLAHVTYLVDPSTPLGTVVNVMLEATSMNFPSPAGTYLLDANGGQIPAVLVDGTITIGNPIPEPASVTLLGIAGVVMLAGTRLARRRLRAL
jgi:hypothetical protein